MMKTQSLTFPEAVERLAEEVGLEVPKQSPEEAKRAERSDILREAVSKAVDFFEAQLHSAGGRQALEYLRGRGLTDPTIKAFRLGYAPKGNALKTELKRAGIPDDVLLEARLISEGRDGRDSFDFFRDRVMFPINDARGRAVAFGGRVMGDGQPKYLTSPETPVFHTGHILFALDKARKAILDQDQVIVCEGYMDVIALANAGIGNAVAPLGTAITETQVQALWRLTPEPVLCFDGDKAGRKAAARAAERVLPLLEPGYSLRFALLPEGRDPDDMVRAEGAEAMRALVTHAEPMIDVVWRIAIEGQPSDTPERRAALEARAMDLANTIQNQTLRSYYQQAMKDRIWSLVRRPQPGRPHQGRQNAPWRGGGYGASPAGLPPNRRRAPVDPAVRQAHLLLAAVINHPALLDEVDEQLGEIAFPDSRLESVRRAILKHYSASAEIDHESLKSALHGDGLSEALGNVLKPDLYAMHKFIRPGADFGDVRAGWRHTFRMFKEAEQRAERQTAVQALAHDPSEQTFEALKALGTSPSARDDDPLDS